MNSSRPRIRSPSFVSSWWKGKGCSSNICPGGPSALAGSKLKMWQTQSKTNAFTLRSRALASPGRVSVVAMAWSGSSLLGDPGPAVGLELLERHDELLPRRLRQAVHRPDRVPDGADLDRLDAVHLAQAFGYGGRHRRDERAPAGRQDEVDVDVRAVDADVLDDAHVDDAHAAVRAARVVDVAQCVDDLLAVGGAGLVHGRLSSSHGSLAILKPVVGVALAGSAESAREVRTPHAWSRYEPPRTVRQPSSSGASETHSQTLPASCCAPVCDAPSAWARTGAVQPAPASAQAQRSGSNVGPHGQGRPSSPRAAASHSSPVGSRAPAHAQNASASANVSSVAGWSASCGSSRRTARPALAAWPVSSANARTWALTTGKRPIANAAISTSRSSPGSPRR